MVLCFFNVQIYFVVKYVVVEVFVDIVVDLYIELFGVCSERGSKNVVCGDYFNFNGFSLIKYDVQEIIVINYSKN